jgi:hypothetical protein
MAGRTDGPAIDARGFHANEKQAVISRVACKHGLITGFVIEFHERHIGHRPPIVSRFSDVIERGPE